MSDPIATLVTPRYITRVIQSNARRAKYYKEGDKIPKRLQKIQCYWKKGYLYGPDGRRVVANPRVAGKPKYLSISGNKFSTGYESPLIRNKIVRGLKDYYRPFVRKMKPIPLEFFPIRVEWDIYTVVSPANFDLDNLWVYYKYMEDCLHERENPVTKERYHPIIPDDTIRWIAITRA